MSVTLSGIPSTSSSVSAVRLTGDAATTIVGEGAITVAGQTFANGTCELQGTKDTEKIGTTAGVATFTVQASEALLIYV